MGYEHATILKAKVAAGVSVEQVAEALKPIMEYFGYDGVDAFCGEDMFFFDPQTGILEVLFYGKVGYSYPDIVRETAANLGRIVAEPGEIRLYDYDTANIDEAKTVIEFGPSEEAIRAYIAKRDIEAGLEMMKPHLPVDVLTAIRQIVL